MFSSIKKINIKLSVLLLVLIFIETLTYFLAKFTPIEPYLLVSSFDDKLPLIEEFIYFYVIWYLMLFFVPYLIYYKDKKVFLEYVGTYLGITFISFLIFFFIPTTIIRPEINGVNISSCLLKFIYESDTPALNCLPSMHCAVCFLFIYYCFRLKDLKVVYKIMISIISILIIISTLLIKQHVIWDVIGALILVVLAILTMKVFKLDKYVQRLIKRYI